MTSIKPSPTVPAASDAYRSDIDGLRALAILLVVVYHVWLGRVSGGVDVFLMISAFFLTASFVRRARRGGALNLGAFWLRRFRRLLPAAAVTIGGILAAAWLLYPQTEWPQIWREAWASLFYVENWALASSEVDYYARDAATPSPFQHFWSLSVQGQVFVIWPVVIALIFLVMRKRREHVVTAMFVVFAVIFAISLWFSITETATHQSLAYFDTRTRLWEFAAGSLIAIALPALKLPDIVRAITAWVGVIGIVICGIVLDVQGGFPGYLALWPVVSAALVIVGGQGSPRGGPSALLASPAMRFIGRDAYSLYLVHWPVLITWMTVTGRSRPGWLSGLSIIVLSMILARLISWGVENPLRRAPVFDRSRLTGGLVIVASLLVVAAPLSGWQIAQNARAAAIESASSDGYPGAAQIDTPVDLSQVDLPLKPVATALDSEWVALGEECKGALEPQDDSLEGTCSATADAADQEKPLILTMGDSHAQQLMSPLVEVARQHGWGLASLLKGGCAIGVGAPSWSNSGAPCDEWREAAVDYAMKLKPDAVYLVVTRATPEEPETAVEGIDEIIARFKAADIDVIGVRDNPRFRFDMYECVATDRDCSGTTPGADPSVERIMSQVVAVDFHRWLCDADGECPGQIGNIAVYIDDNHISATYGRTLAPMLTQMLSDGGLDEVG